MIICMRLRAQAAADSVTWLQYPWTAGNPSKTEIMHTYPHSHIHSLSLTHTHTHTYTHTHTHTHTYTQKTYARTHTHTQTQTHTKTHRHTDTDTDTDIYTHTHTHTHTHMWHAAFTHFDDWNSRRVLLHICSNYSSLLQDVVFFIGLFCKRNL